MIRLERDLVVETFDVQCTVAIGHDRPELLAVARLASDLGPIGGVDVCRELLGGLPEQVGWRVIDRCLGLGLLERSGDRGPAGLSSSGSDALEFGAVLVPEEGVWRFFVANADPLIDARVLHVVRIPDQRDAIDERKALKTAKAEGKARPAQGDAPPDPLRPSGRVDLSVATHMPFEVREIAARGTRGPAGRLRLTCECDEKATPIARLRGKLERVTETIGPWDVDSLFDQPRALTALSYDDLWLAALGAWSGLGFSKLNEWKARVGSRCVPVPFDAVLDEPSRRAMRRTVQVPAGNVLMLGVFEQSRIENVPLVPQSDADAQRWAEWLLMDSIHDYVVPDGVRAIAEGVRSRFPSRPRLPEPTDLLTAARLEPGRPGARFQLAPADLGLWR